MNAFFGRKGTFGLILVTIGTVGFLFKSESANLSSFFTFLNTLGGAFFLGNVGEHFAKKAAE